MNDFDDEEPTTEVVDMPMAELVTQPVPARTHTRERRETRRYGSPGRMVLSVGGGS